MKTYVRRDGEDYILNGQKTWTTSAHFAEWYWVGARTDPEVAKHFGITLFLVPLDDPGITVNGIWTMGDERTNDVFLDNVFVHDDYVVGEVNKGFQYISQALDLERFTMFTFSPIKQRLDLLIDYVREAERDGERLREEVVEIFAALDATFAPVFNNRAIALSRRVLDDLASGYLVLDPPLSQIGRAHV